MRLPMRLTSIALALLVGACTAAPNGEATSAAEPSAARQVEAAPATSPSSTPPPPAAEPPSSTTPLPKAISPPTTSPADDGAAKDATGTQAVDYSCSTDADCAIKDVGNCCGYYPACVNAESPTFPDQVKAQCARSGTMSVCGFPTIEGCQCVDNRCQAAAGGARLQQE